MQFVTNQTSPHIALRVAKWAGIGLIGLFAMLGVSSVIGQAPTEAPPIAKAAADTVSSAPIDPEEVATSDAAAAADAFDAAHQPQAGASSMDYLTLAVAAKAQLTSKLTDSQGVRFRGVRTELSTLDGAGIVAFCGEENSKTPLGGYAGFSRFIASQSTATTEADMTLADFDQAWQQFCTGVEGPKVWL